MTLDKALYILSHGSENLQTYLVAVSVIKEELETREETIRGLTAGQHTLQQALGRKEKEIEAHKHYYSECLRDLAEAHKREVHHKSKYDKLKASYDCEISYEKALNKQSVERAVKELAEDIKMAFYYEFNEIIPSVMADKIDELVKERLKVADVKWSVYIHTCPNGKKYIGITTRSCEERWRNGHGYRNNKHFHSAILKYGWNNIVHEVLATELSKEEAFLYETSLIALYKSNDPLYGYNHSEGGEGKTGFSPSEETKRKIKDKLTGKHRPDEVKQKVSAAHLGKPLTVEHKEKIKISCRNINSKKVVCITTGAVYPSASEAARQVGISKSGITACCRGEKSSCKKLEWAYIERSVCVGK